MYRYAPSGYRWQAITDETIGGRIVKRFVEDCLEFLFRTVGGVFVLCVLILLIFMAIFWPRPAREPLPWLGVVGSDVSAKMIQQSRLPFTKGVRVERVFTNSPADLSNIAPGDFIVQLNKQLVSSQGHLQTLLSKIEPKEGVPVTIYRSGSYYNLLIQLAKRPTDNWIPGDAAAFTPGAQLTSIAPPPITPDAILTHPFRGVCSNCHVIVSKLAANQSNAQLVAALRQQPVSPLPQQALPRQQIPVDVIPAPPTSEFSWAGIDVAPLGPGAIRTLGLPPNATGVVADEVLRGGRGERGGLRNGDLIREINGVAVPDVNAFATILRSQNLTGGVLLVQRAGETVYVTVPEA